MFSDFKRRIFIEQEERKGKNGQKTEPWFYVKLPLQTKPPVRETHLSISIVIPDHFQELPPVDSSRKMR